MAQKRRRKTRLPLGGRRRPHRPRTLPRPRRPHHRRRRSRCKDPAKIITLNQFQTF